MLMLVREVQGAGAGIAVAVPIEPLAHAALSPEGHRLSTSLLTFWASFSIPSAGISYTSTYLSIARGLGA